MRYIVEVHDNDEPGHIEYLHNIRPFLNLPSLGLGGGWESLWSRYKVRANICHLQIARRVLIKQKMVPRYFLKIAHEI